MLELGRNLSVEEPRKAGFFRVFAPVWVQHAANTLYTGYFLIDPKKAVDSKGSETLDHRGLLCVSQRGFMDKEGRIPENLLRPIAHCYRGSDLTCSLHFTNTQRGKPFCHCHNHPTQYCSKLIVVGGNKACLLLRRSMVRAHKVSENFLVEVDRTTWCEGESFACSCEYEGGFVFLAARCFSER